MGFFSDDIKKISDEDVRGVLRELRSNNIITDSEKEYLKGYFGRHASNGLSKKELEEAIYELYHDHNDHISESQVKAIEKALKDKFE